MYAARVRAPYGDRRPQLRVPHVRQSAVLHVPRRRDEGRDAEARSLPRVPHDLGRRSQDGPDEGGRRLMRLPLFPLHAVLVPGATMSLQVFEPRYQELLRRCRQNRESFGIVLIREGREVGGTAIPFAVGTEAKIVAVEDLPGGRAHVLVEGHRRFRILRIENARSYTEADIDWLPEPLGESASWRRTVLDLLATCETGI